MKPATPAQILESWRAIAPIFGNKYSAWIKFLIIAEAGKKGVPVSVIRNGHDTCFPIIRKWQAARLITVEMRPPSGTRGGHPRRWITITKRGLKLLQINAPKNHEAQA